VTSDWIDPIAAALSEGPGFVVVPYFMPATELIEDFDSRRSEFRRAAIGRAGNLTVQDEIRRDETLWFDPTALSVSQNRLWSRLQELRQGLNARLFLGLWDLEGHYASYPAGGFYKKHVDRFQSSSARTISLVFYLNPNWQVEDGGELLIYSGSEVARKVEPRAGTLVCFMSDTVEHEVAAAYRERKSFAGWMRTRSQFN
jgi:SM-20-related protein